MERQRDESSEAPQDAGPAVGAHNTLNYLDPREDAPAPTGGDVVQGAVAVCVAIACCLAAGGFAWLTQNRHEDWTGGQYVVMVVCVALALVGAAAAVRSVRHYLTGKHRIRKATPRRADDARLRLPPERLP
jgi:hypothetical protein